MFLSGLVILGLSACAQVSVPDARNVKIPSPISAEERQSAINERPDSVMYLPLGQDVLVPARISGSGLPKDIVGPFELRGETLAGALQLILADYDISIAFETEEGLTRKVTVANLKGELGKVVNSVCSLADLYCSYEDGALVVKDTQTFTVTLPPLAGAGGGSEFISDVIQGLSAVIGDVGSSPVSDPTTRTIIYSATQRTSQLAENYFQRLRANTAMIVFETYIWEVSLNSGNSTGIKWNKLASIGKFNASINIEGSSSASSPVSIGLPTTGTVSPTEVLDFLSEFGAVKTISQPQITVLSGSEAELRVADTENYVSEITSTISGDQTATSVSTDTAESGFTITIDSSWDKSTVYANVEIDLDDVTRIVPFTFSGSGADDDSSNTRIQLPFTTQRELSTQIRVRPGDSVLIAGLVRERDNFDSRGPGFMEPIIPDSREATTENFELVVLLRPRVIVYTSEGDLGHRGMASKTSPMQVSPSRINSSLMSSELPKRAPRPYVAPQAPAPVPAPVVVEPVLQKNPTPNVVPVNTRAVFEPESEPLYAPTNKSGYMPSYSDRKRVSQQIAIEPTIAPIAPSYEPQVYSRQSYENPVEVYNAPTSPSPYQPSTSVDAPLSSEVYNNASPINVYEAYERSQNSYYAQ